MVNHFLQSREWEEFQKSVGREVFRVEGALVTKLPLAFGKSYFYCGGYSALNGEQVRDIAKKENVVFLKLEPMVEKSTGTVPVDFKKSGKEVQPQKTIVLDLTKPEEELLAKMQEKTRYNIRLAGKKELRIKNIESSKDGGIEGFWRILQKTTARDNFSSHDKQYYHKLVESFSSPDPKPQSLDSSIRIFCAYRGDAMIAANIILFHGDTAYYLHGASDYTYRSLMAPYLLHWEIIKYAKERGYTEYDLWGVDERKWPGVTRFKRGFSGDEIEYIGSYDYVFQPLWYGLYELRSFVRNFSKTLTANS